MNDLQAPDNDGWIRTFTGGRFYPLAPRVCDFDIRDIAHALALSCRYGKQCKEFYSVAQHSVIVSHHCGEHAMWGLLHDLDEAYSPFGDIPRPVKKQLPPEILEVGNRIMRAACEWAGLPTAEPPAVKAADDAILWNERDVLMTGDLTLMPTSRIGLPLDGPIAPLDWRAAERLFLDRFDELYSRP